MTAHTTRAHLVRAVLESLTLRVRDIVEALARPAPVRQMLRVDGGMTANRWMMQRQADVLGIPVRDLPTSRGDRAGRGASRPSAPGSIAGRAGLAGGRGHHAGTVGRIGGVARAEYAGWLEFVENHR